MITSEVHGLILIVTVVGSKKYSNLFDPLNILKIIFLNKFWSRFLSDVVCDVLKLLFVQFNLSMLHMILLLESERFWIIDFVALQSSINPFSMF